MSSRDLKQALKEEAELATVNPEPHAGTAPPPPKRPESPFKGTLKQLHDAFPDAPEKVARAVLVASGGQLEAAFNGMLALEDDAIRPQPPTPVVREQQSQIAKDEELARRLAHGDRRSERRTSRQRSTTSNPDEAGPWEDIQRGWGETKERMTSIFGQLRERIQNEWKDDDIEGPIYDRRDSPRDSRPSKDAGPPPRPPRPPKKPVNAFGEEQATRWQPLETAETNDAFFIGESDDSDLESLTGDSKRKDSVQPPLPAKEPVPEKSVDKDVLEQTNTPSTPAAAPESEETKVDAKVETESVEEK